MAAVNNWDKFRLLLWKNWILQKNHKAQIFIELLLPAIFWLPFVLIRFLIPVRQEEVTIYPELNITDLGLFIVMNEFATRMQSALNKGNKWRNSTEEDRVQFKLLYSPNTSIIFENIIREATSQLQLKPFDGYANAADLEDALMKGNYLAGVQFDDKLANIDKYPEKLAYSLRFPSILRNQIEILGHTWMTNKLFPSSYGGIGPRNPTAADGGIPVGYLCEGFLPVQNAISSAYLSLAGNVSNIPDMRMRRYPYPPYIDDQLLKALSGTMTLMMVLSFIYPCAYITRYIISEKEKQLKEVMKIMGLPNWIHWTAWFVKSFIMLGISGILIMIFIKKRWIKDVAILTHTDWTVLLFFLLVYITTSICFCFMMAVFFSKANTAAAVAGLIWFVAYLPYTFVIDSYDDMTLTSKLGWSLISNTALGFCCKLIMGFEATGEGFQWSNIFKPNSVDDNLTIGAIILIMLLSCIIYMTICLYIEQIFPGDFGVPKKWSFPFSKQFWYGEKMEYYGGTGDIANRNVERTNPNAFEAEPTGKHIGVQVRNLQRKFGNKMVVKGVSMNMYEDDITVLLGHNGAGKTTTISMLTGMIPPSGGTAIINGSDIRTNMDRARMSMGICPQHNVLFDDLTVAEHLMFFSRLKGAKGSAIKMEVDKYLKIIQLEDKANVASMKLSGGMKRKLSVCCALCGGTKVVLCDEPSSGMDPAARRQLWDLLQAEKIGRTVLLTTHYMDEAEVLGDRVAIMCDGELKCLGTTFFLKKIYGSGYKLICVKRENCKTSDVTRLLQNFIPNLQPEQDIGAELTFRLPDSASPLFEEMFSELERNSDTLNLSGYGISISSLEEVFMKVGAEKAVNGGSSHDNDLSGGQNEFPEDDIESIASEKIFSDNTRLLEGYGLLSNQWRAMLLKKHLYTSRNKLMLLLQNLIPVFFVVATLIGGRNQGSFNTLKPLNIKLDQYPLATIVLEKHNNFDKNSFESKISEQYEAIINAYGGGGGYSFESTGDKNFTEHILDLGGAHQIRINSRYVAAATVAKGELIAWLNNQPLHTAPLTVNLLHNAMAKALLGTTHEIEVTNAPLPFTAENRLQQLNMEVNLGERLVTRLCFSMCFVSAFYILFLIKERESRSKLLQFVGGVRVWTFWLSQYLWDYIMFIVTAIIIIITIAAFQEPCLSTIEELSRVFLIFLLFGLSVLPFTYIISMRFSDPATGFARYSILSIFAGLVMSIIITIMSIEIFGLKHVVEILQLFFRAIPHFSLAQSLNHLYSNASNRKMCESIRKAFSEDDICQLFPKCCYDVAFFGWVSPGVLPEIVYFLCTAIVYFVILIIIEYRLVDQVIHKMRQILTKPPLPPEDGYFEEDVAKERDFVQRMNSDELQAQNLVLDRVTKYYGNFLAVNQVSVCVRQSECFGLLGVNGAGKTSTFKMMTGDERISYGDAYVIGMSLNSKMSSIYKVIGYCPQFDALLDDLTGREMLEIFCLLRGIPKSQIPQISIDLAESFGFIEHLDKETRAYSGGNKRKLSTAIAVIGSPLVIYLDEPTTGMDPAARRQLWNMICHIRDGGKSIVLTSHSMGECEALCTRLAIMVNGEFKCLGSTQQLKNKFSKGLILKIKLKKTRDVRAILPITECDDEKVFQSASDSLMDVKEFVENQFENSILQEQYQGILTFYIPLTSVTWSEIFGLMESNKQRLKIEDYSVSQTTLEEIFLEFAKHQRHDTRALK